MSTCCPFTNEIVILTNLPVAIVFFIITDYLIPYTPNQLIESPVYRRIHENFYGLSYFVTYWYKDIDIVTSLQVHKFQNTSYSENHKLRSDLLQQANDQSKTGELYWAK